MKSIKHTYYNGFIEYRNEEGYTHREDGPALIHPNGSEYYWLNGICYTYKEWFNLISIAYKWKEFCEID